MYFSKLFQGSKSTITIRPVSIESTLLLFLLISNFLGNPNLSKSLIVLFKFFINQRYLQSPKKILSSEKILNLRSYMVLWLPEKFWCKPQNGQPAPKSSIFKMVKNHHHACFRMWGQSSNTYNLYIVRKEILSELILS